MSTSLQKCGDPVWRQFATYVSPIHLGSASLCRHQPNWHAIDEVGSKSEYAFLFDEPMSGAAVHARPGQTTFDVDYFELVTVDAGVKGEYVAVIHERDPAGGTLCRALFFSNCNRKESNVIRPILDYILRIKPDSLHLSIKSGDAQQSAELGQAWRRTMEDQGLLGGQTEGVRVSLEGSSRGQVTVDISEFLVEAGDLRHLPHKLACFLLGLTTPLPEWQAIYGSWLRGAGRAVQLEVVGQGPEARIRGHVIEQDDKGQRCSKCASRSCDHALAAKMIRRVGQHVMFFQPSSFSRFNRDVLTPGEPLLFEDEVSQDVWLDPVDDPHAARGIPCFKPTSLDWRDPQAFLDGVAPWFLQGAGACRVSVPAGYRRLALKSKHIRQDKVSTTRQTLRRVEATKGIIQKVPAQVQEEVLESLEYRPPAKQLDVYQICRKEGPELGVFDYLCPGIDHKHRKVAELLVPDPREYSTHKLGEEYRSWVAALSNATAPPVNYAEHQPRSVFESDVEKLASAHKKDPWLLGPAFPSFLSDQLSLPGITTPFSYYGVKNSAFPCHTEDMYLSSANRLVAGAPKIWSVCSTTSYDSLCTHIDARLPLDAWLCEHQMAHKNILVLPHDMPTDVDFNVVPQRQDDVILTAPQGLHSGWNTGPNVAIAVNFATQEWLQHALLGRYCHCAREGEGGPGEDDWPLNWLRSDVAPASMPESKEEGRERSRVRQAELDKLKLRHTKRKK